MFRQFLLTLIFMGLSLQSAWGAKTIGNPKAPVGGTFYINLDAEPSTLNPLKGTDGYASAVKGYVFDSLLTRNIETFEFEPALAEKWEVAKDGKTITFTIRPGATFHDGTPITMEDIQFSYDVNFDPKLTDATRKIYYENFEKIEIVDAKTIRFHIKTKYFKNIESAGGLTILPKSFYSDPNKKVNKVMMGSGPYKLEKYDQGRSIVLKRNEKWWGFNLPQFAGYYKFDKIHFRFIKDETAKLESFKKGDLDYLGLTPEQYEKKTEGAPWGSKVLKQAVENSAPKGTAYMTFNLRLPIFKEKDTRQALSMLLNREFMVEKFFYNKYIAAAGPWYAQSQYADPSVKAPKFDPAGAQKLLKKAGWEDSDKDGVLDKMIDGKKVKFAFSVINGGGPWEKWLTVFKEDLKKAGVDMTLKVMEWNAFQKALHDWNFELAALAVSNPVEIDAKQMWHSSSITHDGSNVSGYSNPEVDKLIDEARVELDTPKRVKLVRKIYRIIAEDYPWIFFYTPKYGFYGYNSRIDMAAPTYKYGVDTDTWWVKP